VLCNRNCDCRMEASKTNSGRSTIAKVVVVGNESGSWPVWQILSRRGIRNLGSLSLVAAVGGGRQMYYVMYFVVRSAWESGCLIQGQGALKVRWHIRQAKVMRKMT
jgi:hypothetical protein